ncbi:MaoC/PaaZ C-terminal domain-containing protein [Aciditerrimonas ferrireducens]|uniref:MaoC/PaaZ C-terminal domain-containing protein n=1 Tax=Aciditerrimonas ferrireducens TaxID=667306 RepID=A0ABV6C4J2_9ACTN
MGIDPSKVTGAWSEPVERTWSATDAILYALGVGAAAEDPLGPELAFVSELTTGRPQRVLPTFATIVGRPPVRVSDLGEVDHRMLVDGGRRVRWYRPLPPEGRALVRGRLAGVYDKGSGALLVSQAELRDAEDGELLCTLEAQAFLRGAGGFGGDRGPSGPRHQPPERPPDEVVTLRTRPDQALLYRLSGDRNPLHADPAFAEAAGFPRPILHGLCTFGFTGRALLQALCGHDPARLVAMEGRFSKPVYPGESLAVSIWRDEQGAIFQTTASSGQVVVDQGRCEVAAP